MSQSHPIDLPYPTPGQPTKIPVGAPIVRSEKSSAFVARRGATSWGRRVSPRRILARVFLLLVGSAAPLIGASRADATCTPPRCFDVVVPVPAGLSVPENAVRVILPEGYDESNQRYPVLYLLHGAGDTFATWTENTDAQELSAQFPLIIVMPDSGRDANAGFYSDWLDGSRQWETFHTRVLRRFIDARFRTLASRRHRAVAGLSMGGFGAMSYAARHRDLFSAAASFSGAVDTLYPTAAGSVLFAAGIVGSGIWGDPATHESLWRRHNPTDLAKSLRGTPLFLATGDGTMGGPAGDIPAPAAYGTEAIVKIMNDSFAAALDEAGVAYVSDFYRGGYHGWPYWERSLHWLLPQLMELIGADASGGTSRCRVSRSSGTTDAPGRSIRSPLCRTPRLG